MTRHNTACDIAVGGLGSDDRRRISFGIRGSLFGVIVESGPGRRHLFLGCWAAAQQATVQDRPRSRGTELIGDGARDGTATARRHDFPGSDDVADARHLRIGDRSRTLVTPHGMSWSQARRGRAAARAGAADEAARRARRIAELSGGMASRATIAMAWPPRRSADAGSRRTRRTSPCGPESSLLRNCTRAWMPLAVIPHDMA